MRSPISRIMASVVAMLLAATASATVLNVPGQYPTINSACYAAVAGDTVAIAPGTYEGTGASVRAGVTILGLGGGPGQVRVRMVGCYAFQFSSGAESSRLENLEVQGTIGVMNHNRGLVIHDCRLLDESFEFDRLVITDADVRLEACWLGCMSESTYIIFLADVAGVEFCDCIIGQATTAFFDYIPPGSSFEITNCTFMGPVYVWPESASGAQFAVYFVNCIMPQGTCRTIIPDTMEWRYNDFTNVGCEYPLGTYLIGNFTADPLFCGATDFRIDYGSPCRGSGEGGEDVGARLGYCNVPAQVERDPNAVRGTLWVSPPWPNPTSSGASFAFRSRPGEIINVQIFDLEGGLIRGMRTAASNDLRIFRWDGRDAASHPVPAGTYFLQVQAGTDRASQQIVVFQ